MQMFVILCKAPDLPHVFILLLFLHVFPAIVVVVFARLSSNCGIVVVFAHLSSNCGIVVIVFNFTLSPMGHWDGLSFGCSNHKNKMFYVHLSYPPCHQLCVCDVLCSPVIPTLPLPVSVMFYIHLSYPPCHYLCVCGFMFTCHTHPAPTCVHGFMFTCHTHPAPTCVCSFMFTCHTHHATTCVCVMFMFTCHTHPVTTCVCHVLCSPVIPTMSLPV